MSLEVSKARVQYSTGVNGTRKITAFVVSKQENNRTNKHGPIVQIRHTNERDVQLNTTI